MKKELIISLLLTTVLATPLSAFAKTNDAFNLAGVIENIINYQTKDDFTSEIRNDSRENFISATENLYNGNIVVAYNEFYKTIETLDRNFALLMLSKKLYEYGFFSLGDIAITKISGKDKMQEQIAKLKDSYTPAFALTKEEENYLAKIRASIYYNNSPEEAAFNLVKKTNLLENSDYANFIMANSMFECRQYAQALIYINKAIEKNETNSNYKYFKAKTLVALKKYKEAMKYMDLVENQISIYLESDFKLLKQQLKSELASNDNDKKFHQLYSYYLTGNYYKVLKETQNILNFSRNNPKILTLQAMTHLALGETKLARDDFEASYKMDKKFNLTLMGLADCDFIDKNYKQSYDGYKKLFNTEYKKEAVLKAYIALNELNPNDKKLDKLEKTQRTFDSSAFYEYYLIANNLYQDDSHKRKYAAKSLSINFLNQDTWDIFLSLDYKNKNFDNIDRTIFFLLFSDNLNADYYYYSALSLNHANNKKEAFLEVKKALALDPDYKPAIELMNTLQDELI